MDKKWTIGLGLLGILIVFLLLWNFAPAIQRWLEFGKPRYAFLVTGGNIDSMVAHYTAAKRRRSDDERNARNITQAQKK